MQLVYRIAADAIVVAHFAYVAFVVVGLVLILVGVLRGWQWVRGFTFRLLHLAAIGLVVAESLFGVMCPLTTWERNLRELAGQASYQEAFLARWVHTLLFYQAEPRAFTIAYIVFGLAVLTTFVLAPPRFGAKMTKEDVKGT